MAQITQENTEISLDRGIEYLENLAVEYFHQARYGEATTIGALVLSERKRHLGSDHPDVATALNNLALFHKVQGHFVDAEALYREALAIRETALGCHHSDVATSLSNLGELYRAQGRFDEAEPLYRRALVISETMLGPDHPDVAYSLNNLALLYWNRGNLGDTEPLYRRALGIFRKELGSSHAEVATVLANLSELCRIRGRYDDAEELCRQALTIRKKALGSGHPDLGSSLESLGGIMQDKGHYDEAERLFQCALAILEKALGPDHPDVAVTLSNLAAIHRVRGHYGEAEPLCQRALAISENRPDRDPSILAVILNNLASIYRAQGRYREAEPLFRRAADVYEETRGPDHRDVATILNNLGGLFWAQGRYAEAEPFYQNALRIYNKAFCPDHPEVATSTNNLAALYCTLERYSEAGPLAKQALETLEKVFGPNHPAVARALVNLGVLCRWREEYGDAECLYRRAMIIQEKALGPNHPDLSTVLYNLALLQDRQERLAEALELVRRASAIGRKRAAIEMRPRTSGLLAEQAHLTDRYRFHVNVLARAIDQGVASSREGVEEGFELMQLALRSRTERAIVRMAARFAAGSGTLAELARQREDALDRWEASEEELMQAISKPADEHRFELATRFRAEIAAAEGDISKLDAVIAHEFPEYAALINPQPIPLGETQTLLGEEQALVVYLAGEEASHVFVVRRNDARLLTLKPNGQALAETVTALRGGLDPHEGRSVGSREGTADDLRDLQLSSGGESGGGHFDIGRAHQLYLEIWAPVEPFVAGAKHVFVVADRALESLPFHILVTQRGPTNLEEPEGLRRVEWLAKREQSISTLPSAGVLNALRGQATKTKPGDGFIGFGNPVLGGERPPELPVVNLNWRGMVADVDGLRSLRPLPESEGELKQLAQSLGWPKTALFLGPQATERQVRALNISKDLASAGVLAFATHGVMAGELGAFKEPGLVLTPPEQPSEDDDGFLTASEIAQLDLNADWVLLSACNTAAADGSPGAEGLSGLTRAFFYAGARALLVSHWSVYSEAAVKLTTGTFEQLKRDPSIGRAEALRRTMAELIDHGPNPSPAYWAPFVIVG
jgi:tetratricopeptide (TPR) repeat protein/CHAT domain-containing protein